MFDMNDFIEFIKNNNVAGIANPIDDLDKISLQDLKILYSYYANLSS